MVKLILFSIFLCAMNASCGSQNCQAFKNGTFKLFNAETNTTFIINRVGALQTESLENRKVKLRFMVTWINECSYTLKPTKETLKLLPGTPPDAILTVKMTNIKQNSYTQTSTSNFADYSRTSEMIKVD